MDYFFFQPEHPCEDCFKGWCTMNCSPVERKRKPMALAQITVFKKGQRHAQKLSFCVNATCSFDSMVQRLRAAQQTFDELGLGFDIEAVHMGDTAAPPASMTAPIFESLGKMIAEQIVRDPD